jgi:acetolactate synthase-1/2/3 large subunit
MTTVAARLVELLRGHGVDTVFGIPGVHTIELYRALASSGLRHVTPRHEQGAGFMADGYARRTGRPGVAFVITGPGLTNILTAMAQARADSIPMLVVSGAGARAGLGRDHGALHELPDQRRLAEAVAVLSHTLLEPAALPEFLAQAFARFATGRPGPAHLEIPIDLMAAPLSEPPPRPRPAPPAADPAAVAAAAARLAAARRPVLIAGGGARRAAEPVRALAEVVDAPVVTTVNGRGLLAGHPLSVPASPSLPAVRRLLSEADAVLALGTELGPTDFDIDVDGGAAPLPGLLRVDVDPGQLARGPACAAALVADAGAAAEALRCALPPVAAGRDGPARAAAARAAAAADLSPAMRAATQVLALVRAALPGCTIVGDSTEPVYAGNLIYEPDAPGGWFNSATGFGTLGYALPAAIGAALADPAAPVVALVGDGGLQFTLAELGTAADVGARVIVLVWNNGGYGEIARAMRAVGAAPLGCDPSAPDFVAVARAYGLSAARAASPEALVAALRAAAAATGPSLIDFPVPHP